MAAAATSEAGNRHVPTRRYSDAVLSVAQEVLDVKQNNRFGRPLRPVPRAPLPVRRHESAIRTLFMHRRFLYVHSCFHRAKESF